MRKRNLIFYLVFLNIFFLSLNSPKVRAHASTNMNLAFNFNSQKLNVSLTHAVSNPNTHYILSVTIRVNGTLENSETYTDQPTTSTFTYQYNVTAGIGASIQVTAVCNVFGTLSQTIMVSDPNAPPGSFSLSSDAGNPDNDGSFNLIWTDSLGADNYSVYNHSSYIVGINQSLNQLADQNALSPLQVQGFLNDTHYIVVVAYNRNGNRTSNVEIVNVEITPGGISDGPVSIAGYNLILLLGSIAIVIVIVFRKKLRI
ncbi:hypothetical protein LCGC14_1321690 [marine sediment metagenome]|uniref:Uncharacterized protein n=1 Tax=marine sediment metagenome TaxID=412755 RepID=A0A0F9N014_9ZZZZ